jgi:5-methylcytosine-specific restriction endonuclease McrA
MIFKWFKVNSGNFKHQYYYNVNDNNIISISKIDKETTELVTLIGQYSLDGKLINNFRTQKEASEKISCSTGDLSSCINEKKGHKSVKGYIWKKLENQKPIPKTHDEIIIELNKNIMKKGKERHGNTYFSIMSENGKTKRVVYYRFIYYIYNQDKVSGCAHCGKDPSIFCIFNTEHHDIDHIDGNHSNNDPINLQRLCSYCHSKKTNKQTREQQNITKKQNREKKSKINVYKNGEEEIFKTFSSQIECKKELKIPDSTIKKSIENKTYTAKCKDGNKYLFELVFEEIEGEIWKDIPLELGKSKVSNKGRVKTIANVIGYGNSKYGYLEHKKIGVHILVAKTFLIGEYEKKVLEIKQKFPDISIEEIKNSTGKRYSIMVDHIDRNPINNCLENLRWVSVQENNLNTNRQKEIEQWSLDGTTLINTFSCQKEACEKLGVSSGQMSRCVNINGDLKQLKGFIFKIKEENIESVDSPEEKSLKIFLPQFENFKKFISKNGRTPHQRKDDLGTWYNTIKQEYKNKTACMSYGKIYNLWNEFVNLEENKKYFLDWNDTWLINFNKMTDLFNNKLKSEDEIKKLKAWVRIQNYNYRNIKHSMTDKNKYDKWTELIVSKPYIDFLK